MFVPSLQWLTHKKKKKEKKGTIYTIGRSGSLEYVPVVRFPFCAVYIAQSCRHCNKCEWWTWQRFGWEPKERNNRKFCLFHHIFNDHCSLHSQGTFMLRSWLMLWSRYRDLAALLTVIWPAKNVADVTFLGLQLMDEDETSTDNHPRPSSRQNL